MQGIPRRRSGDALTRRTFVRAAAASLAPLFLPSTVLGLGRRPPPSERIGVGIIGLKKMGATHVETLLAFPGVQIVGVCDVDSVQREKIRRRVDEYYAAERSDDRYAACASVNEYEALLARQDIDAVVVAAPDHWHERMTVAGCKAGKDVYCEKPLSLTVRAGRRMVDAARRYARIVQTGTQQRSTPEFRHAVELVRNGCIGELRSIHVGVGPPSWDEVLSPQEPPDGFDYDRWLGPAAWAPYHPTRVGSNFSNGWRRLRDYSGGKMTDWGAHHFDIAQWALGTDESGPVEIIPPPPRPGTRVPHIVDGPGVSRDEASFGLRYRYAGGAEIVKDHFDGILFVGSEGRIDVTRGRIVTTPGSLRTHRFGPNAVRVAYSDHHHADFFDAVRTRRRPIADVAIGHRSASVCHLGNIALWLGRAIRWDASAERVIDDEPASRLLDRPARRPYCD